MQPETLNRSIQPTPTVHPRGFTPTFVIFSTGVDTIGSGILAYWFAARGRSSSGDND